jgi:hypothetical protein
MSSFVKSQRRKKISKMTTTSQTMTTAKARDTQSEPTRALATRPRRCAAVTRLAYGLAVSSANLRVM